MGPTYCYTYDFHCIMQTKHSTHLVTDFRLYWRAITDHAFLPCLLNKKNHLIISVLYVCLQVQRNNCQIFPEPQARGLISFTSLFHWYSHVKRLFSFRAMLTMPRCSQLHSAVPPAEHYLSISCHIFLICQTHSNSCLHQISFAKWNKARQAFPSCQWMV